MAQFRHSTVAQQPHSCKTILVSCRPDECASGCGAGVDIQSRMSPSPDKRNCCIFWRPHAFFFCFVFFGLVLGYTWPPLREIVPLWHKFCHQGNLHMRGFNFKLFLWWQCQNWNPSTVCCLVPTAQLLVMELEFPKVWMGSQGLRFLPGGGKDKKKKNYPDCANVTPRWDQTPN